MTGSEAAPVARTYERMRTRLDLLHGVPGHTRVESVRGYDLCCQECSMAEKDYVAWPCMGVIRHLSDTVLDNMRKEILAGMHNIWDFRCKARDPQRPSKPDARCPTCRTQGESDV